MPQPEGLVCRWGERDAHMELKRCQPVRHLPGQGREPVAGSVWKEKSRGMVPLAHSEVVPRTRSEGVFVAASRALAGERGVEYGSIEARTGAASELVTDVSSPW